MSSVSSALWYGKNDFNSVQRQFDSTSKPSGYSTLAQRAIHKRTRSQYDDDWNHKIADENSSVVGSVVTHTDKGRTNTRACDYRLGDIVRVPHVAPSLDPASALGERHVGYVEATGPVIGKLRPAIVVAIYKNSMTCLPIASSGGRGHSAAEAEHSIMLREWQDNQRAWDDCRETEYVMVSPPYQTANGSYTNLTQAFSVSYLCPIKVSGRLTGRSFERLKRLWKMVIDKGDLPISEQESYAQIQIRKISITGEFGMLRKSELARIAREKGKEWEREKERVRHRQSLVYSSRRTSCLNY